MTMSEADTEIFTAGGLNTFYWPVWYPHIDIVNTVTLVRSSGAYVSVCLSVCLSLSVPVSVCLRLSVI